jgi:hypothetical protein
LVRFGYGSPPDPAKSLGSDRLDPETYCPHPSSSQHHEQVIIQPIQTGFAVETQAEAAGQDFIAQAEAAISIVGEERVPEHDVWAGIAVAKLLQFVGDITH